ncbi:hypothetical protein, partial [Limnobacter sp. UBA1615]|uniref:hypothetical protein n=1 Tax=Limnobacter sp. UBA1615 TaxID=1946757 RepID=UPI0025C26F01
TFLPMNNCVGCTLLNIEIDVSVLFDGFWQAANVNTAQARPIKNIGFTCMTCRVNKEVNRAVSCNLEDRCAVSREGFLGWSLPLLLLQKNVQCGA